MHEKPTLLRTLARTYFREEDWSCDEKNQLEVASGWDSVHREDLDKVRDNVGEHDTTRRKNRVTCNVKRET